MTVQQQAWANLVDSKVTTYFGAALMILGLLCDAGLIAAIAPPELATALCSLPGKAATYLGAPLLMVSRGPNTPPR